MYGNHLHQWVFHFNPFKEEWAGIHRKDWSNYWNGFSTNDILKGETIEEVILKIKMHENKRSNSKRSS